MRVVIVTPELMPYLKTGEIGEVVAPLITSLLDYDIELKVFLPLYEAIDQEKFEIKKVKDVPPLRIPMGKTKKIGDLYVGKFPGTEVEVYFIKNAPYFEREGIYTYPNSSRKYEDNGERFTFFSKACLLSLNQIKFQPHLIHCNDYITALIPAYLRLYYREDAFYNSIAALFTFHSLAEQGEYPPGILDLIGMGKQQFYKGGPFESNGNVNFTKIGISYADIVNTVSETYASEVMTGPTFGLGLEETLKSISNRFFGILNGIEHSKWDPATDTFLPFHYNQDETFVKQLLKGELLEQIRLSRDELLKPIFTLFGPLIPQKGAELVMEVLPKMLKHDLKIIILGRVDIFRLEKIIEYFKVVAKKFPEKMIFLPAAHEKLEHLVIAGSDFALFPALYEPCGLDQLYCLKYGTIPIARETGGLADTVRDYNKDPEMGYGFTFKHFSQRDFLESIQDALNLSNDPHKKEILVKRAMQQDFSWEKSVKEYARLYKEAIGRIRWGYKR